MTREEQDAIEASANALAVSVPPDAHLVFVIGTKNEDGAWVARIVNSDLRRETIDILGSALEFAKAVFREP